MGPGEVGRRTPWQSVQRVRGATAALELLLAATIGGTALRRNPLRSFAGKVAIHIGVSASSDTGSKKSSQRVPTHLGGTIHDVVCQWPMLSDVPGLNGCRYWRFASAWPIWLACPRLRAIPATSALRVSSPSVDPEHAPSSKTASAPGPASRVTAADFNQSDS
jgi:hypothetical protein